MTDRVAVVVLSVPELEAIVRGVVRQALDEHDVPTHLVDEELAIADVVRMFKLAPKSGPKTIWRWRRDRGFPAPRQTGGRARWLRTEIDLWRAERRTSGPGRVEPERSVGRRRRRVGESSAATTARQH